MSFRRLTAFGAIAVLTLAACTSGGASTAPSEPAASEPAAVGASEAL